jgi:hypothetical protein
MRGYRIKKISLPGGRVIEVVYFTDPGDDGAAVDADVAVTDEAVQGGAEAAGRDGPTPMHVCPSCDSDLVYPIAWEEASGSTWHIERRCPNCEWRHVGDFHDDDLARFDEALNEGTETVLIALRDTTRANMEATVERLIDAIKLDLIEPMDF